MKICTVCGKEIQEGQSKRGSGTGYAHLKCLYPNLKLKPAERLPHSKKVK